MHEKFDYNSHWVSEQIENGLFGISNPVVVSILKFSMPWNILSICYTVLFWNSITLSFLYASVLGLIWVNIAPFLIWYYDERVLPAFFNHLSELIPEEQERNRLSKKFNNFFSKHRLSVSLFFTVLLTSIVYVSEPALRAQGMTGTGSIFIWTTYAYATYIGAVLSHGYVGPVTTILLIREITEYELEIDPLHPDNLGGLSTVGYVSIRTTLLFSTASLFLPLLFYFSSAGGVSEVIFAGAGILVLTIFISFIYPTAIVNRRAQEYRDAVLEELREEYHQIEQDTNDPDQNELSELNKRLELERVQRNYDNYNSVSLYPLQVNILFQLIGSVILPLLFMFIEFYLPNLI
ncbi:hypothetical protein [Haloarcula japonica]|uniref:hypothetical protein n=1 Tax=Haloarcula japonica TaxID=29282 RepID=UPI0012694482|nr:hypothetical protein [Haloarcula japonica]